MKIPRAPRLRGKDKRSHKRLDASARGIKVISCGYEPCGIRFLPDRKGQRFHSASCRRLAWIDRHYTPKNAPCENCRALQERIKGLEETIAILSCEPEVEELRRAIAEVSEGKTIPLAEVFRDK